MKDALRVAHLHANQEWGGGEFQLLELNRGLDAQGFFSVLITPEEGVLYRQSESAGVRTEPFPYERRSRNLLLDLMQEWNIRLLHAHDSRGLALGLWLTRRLDVPLMLTRRIASPLRRNPFSRWKYSPRRLVRIIAISKTVRDILCAGGYPEERIVIARDGLDMSRLQSYQPDPEFRRQYGVENALLGGLGKLSKKKNWRLLIRTAAEVQRLGGAARWIVWGEGPERANLEAEARALGVNDVVHFVGFDPDAVRLLKSCDALFFPSRMEGASVTLREAMAMGVPIVAADAPGSIESLAGYGWIVGADDPIAAAHAVMEVLTHPELSAAQKYAAQNYAMTHYRLDDMVAENVCAYDMA